MLHDNKIDTSRIYVYVANQEDYDIYLKTMDKDLYNRLVIVKKGLVPQRQFIMNQWAEGKHIVFFDDDVERIDLSLSPLFKHHNLDYFFRYAFAECKTHGS
jgi:hypothetical protein